MAYTNSNTPTTSSTSSYASDANTSIEAVKDDLRTLKSDVTDLGRAAKEEGKKRLSETATQVQDRVDELKSAGSKELSALKSYVSENPGQSVGYAFAAGLIVSFLFGRR